MQRIAPPPFTQATAFAAVQIAEEAWNSRDAEKVTLLCAIDCVWRNRDNFFQGRSAIEYFLKRKWANESQAQQIKELWAFTENRISVRFECEWQHEETGQWFRTHGNEHWEFDPDGYLNSRDMSANDIPIYKNDQRIVR